MSQLRLSSPPVPPGPSLPLVADALSHLLHEVVTPEFASLQRQVDAIRTAPMTEAGFPSIRPGHCRKITISLFEYLDRNRQNVRLMTPGIVVFIDLLKSFLDTQIRQYPNESLLLQTVLAEALIAAGRAQEAVAVTGPISQACYGIEGDSFVLARVLLVDTQARLACGQVANVRHVAFDRMRLLSHWQRRRETPALFRSFAPALSVGALFDPRASIFSVAVRLLARALIRAKIGGRRGLSVRLWRWIVARTVAGAGGWLLRRTSKRLGRLQIQVPPADGALPDGRRRFRWPSLSAVRRHAGRFLRRARGRLSRRQKILVSRAMGGVGDIIMMTPGLHALAQKSGQPVHFVVPRRFFPVLENNPDVVLRATEDQIDIADYDRWINLSLCPAGRYESRVRPKVRKDRVELFARGMGIRRGLLARHGLRPRYHLSPHQERLREDFRRAQGASGLPILGVQPFSREGYKGYSRMVEALELLAEDHRIVILHSSEVAAPPHPNIVQFFGRPLRDSIAVVAACDYFLCVDSAFYHFAAAFDIPTVALFGPTDGVVCSFHHPRSVLVERPVEVACAPCWRNEDIPCLLSGVGASTCLESILPTAVAATVRRLETSCAR